MKLRGGFSLFFPSRSILLASRIAIKFHCEKQENESCKYLVKFPMALVYGGINHEYGIAYFQDKLKNN